MTSLKTAAADPTTDLDIDVYEVDLTGGSATLNYDTPFDESPHLIVSADDGSGGWSANGASQATITGTDGAVGHVVAIGSRS